MALGRNLWSIGIGEKKFAKWAYTIMMESLNADVMIKIIFAALYTYTFGYVIYNLLTERDGVCPVWEDDQ